MHTIRDIPRLATMLARLIAPRLRSPASIVALHAVTLIVRLGTLYTIVDFDSQIGKKAPLPLVYSLIVSRRQYRNYKEPSRRMSSLQIINVKFKHLQV